MQCGYVIHGPGIVVSLTVVGLRLYVTEKTPSGGSVEVVRGDGYNEVRAVDQQRIAEAKAKTKRAHANGLRCTTIARGAY